MKKVLILSYYWPPSGGAGVQRWLKFTKYLQDYHWEPIIYTAENGEMPVIDHSLEKDIPLNITVLKTPIWEPYAFYKRLIGRKPNEKINASFLSEKKKSSLLESFSVWIRGNFFIPDARKFWIKPSINYLTEFLKKNPVDIIISSGPPHTMHMIALGIKKAHPQLKWVADFRDPWTNIDFYSELKLSRAADNKHKKMEYSVLHHADKIISVSNGMSEQFKSIYNAEPSKFTVITNGFDADDIFMGEIKKDTKFSIAHIGTLVKSRNPEILWKTLSEMISDSAFEKDLEIKLVGKVDYFVNENIEKYGLTKYVRKIDYLPHSEVIKEQQKSKVLLLLVNQTPNAKSILTGKIFEYLAAKVPIIAIGPTNGDLSQIISETGTGFISDFKDKENLKSNILKIYKGAQLHFNTEIINKYSRKELTKSLVNLLDEVCNKN